MGTARFVAKATTVVCLSTTPLLGLTGTAAAEPADPANNDRVFALLPGGYPPGECSASDLYAEDPFIARVGCGPNTDPGGPVGATYSLYANPGDLDVVFNQAASSGDPTACPGASAAGPAAWPGGMVACTILNGGPGHGSPMVSWTNAADALMVAARGTDLGSLYSWWLTAR